MDYVQACDLSQAITESKVWGENMPCTGPVHGPAPWQIQKQFVDQPTDNSSARVAYNKKL